MNTIAIAIDKLDKTGIEKVKAELSEKGLKKDQLNLVENYLNITGSNIEKLAALKKLFSGSETGNKGIEELSYLTSHNSQLIIDITLARGLNYYTGTIFEVKPPVNIQLGSIGGGGRYDDLTGLFGVPGIPGVGISFGVDRIYDVMEELDLFPATVYTGTQVLFFNLGEAESQRAFELMQTVRSKGIRSELYHESSRFDKQFKYAEKKNIPFVVIIGENELKEKQCNLKDLRSGKQVIVKFEELPSFDFS